MTLGAESPLPPFVFSPIAKEKIWGGRTLERRFKKKLPPAVPIGESWEISGYGAEQSQVSQGSSAGSRVEDLLKKYGHRLSGKAVPTDIFPLLIKFIDANDKLSIQVHPTDKQAVAHGWDLQGKTECWYVADAAPGASIIVGFKPGATMSAVAAAVQANTLENLLNQIPVSRGDMLFVPAGTVHAILDNTLIYEIQETSDITFRLYDWGRLDNQGKPRELHVEQSLEVLDYSSHACHKIDPLTVETTGGFVRSIRAACRYFAVEEYLFGGAARSELVQRDSFQVLSVMDGRGSLVTPTGSLELTMGQTVLVPADRGPAFLHGQEGCRALVSWVPGLLPDVVGPLRNAGHTNESILRLGGYRPFNDLVPLIE